MSLSVTNVSDNPQQPSIAAETFVPDQLIAGNLKLVTETITLTGGAALARGAVLGKTVTAATVAAVAGGSNTGNGAMGTVTAGGEAMPGAYQLKITKAASNAGDFEVFDPLGRLVGIGSVAAAFASSHLSFTLADGATDFIVGDLFNITVTPTAEKYKLAAIAATDGSDVPSAILADAADPSGGDVQAGIYLMGEFNSNALSFGTGMTAALAKPHLRRGGIFLKDAVSAADPT